MQDDSHVVDVGVEVVQQVPVVDVSQLVAGLQAVGRAHWYSNLNLQ